MLLTNAVSRYDVDKPNDADRITKQPFPIPRFDLIRFLKAKTDYFQTFHICKVKLSCKAIKTRILQHQKYDTGAK